MASATLGAPGLVIAWLSYLFLLYTLLSAYISGGADVLGSLFEFTSVKFLPWQSTFLFTLLFGLIVYGGIRQVDFFNRGLMFLKLGIYILLVAFITPYVQHDNLQHGQLQYSMGSIMILITSFGFAIIVPNLRDYFDDDIPALKRVIFIGSLIPLFCYLAWDTVIMGTLSSQGNPSLITLMQDPHATSKLASMLSLHIDQDVISTLFHFFTSICMLTAFLGVSLCLMSFLSDGLRVSQRGGQGFVLFLLTFLPPFTLVIYCPGIYIRALSYAGVFCVLLLLLLPALMSFYGRPDFSTPFVVPGRKFSQVFVIISALILLGIGLSYA
jgi:tyrosine-specific transport protein